MNELLKFPDAAKFGKIVAKNKIYENGSANKKVKDLFVEQIDKIIWSYKLSPETVNLQASEGIQEIQVFTLVLRTKDLSKLILQTIDKAIPSPILFELKYSGRTKYAASYKRPSESDKSKWVISVHLISDWMTQNNPSVNLPTVLNMASLYEALLTSLSPLANRPGESLPNLLERVESLNMKSSQLSKLEKKLENEKQFNRRVELNRDLNELKQDVEKLLR